MDDQDQDHGQAADSSVSVEDVVEDAIIEGFHAE